MSKPDTNQASEDELMGELRLLYCRRISSNLSLAEYMLETRQLIQKLIRTEKLKLLAEVRSNLLEMRELKENRDNKGILWGSYDVVDLDDIQGLLTKLEAEL